MMESQHAKKMIPKIPIVTSLILLPFRCHLYICLPIPSRCFSGSSVPERIPREFATLLHGSTSSDSGEGGGRRKIRKGLQQFNQTADSPQRQQQQLQITRGRNSMISSIRCRNLAGIVDTKSPTSDQPSEIVLDLEDDASDDGETKSSNLVAVTGETGSGKSLLVSKIVDLATGGKATASLLRSSGQTPYDTSMDGADSNSRNGGPTPESGTAELVLALYDPAHVSMLSKMLRKLKMDAESILQAGMKVDEERAESDPGCTMDESVYYVRLKRTLSLLNGQRVRSACSINGHPVTLKVMKAIGAPLVAIVDAPAAAAALGREKSRLMMLDAGVPPQVLLRLRQLQTTYRRARMRTHSLEKELARRTLPRSVRDRDSDGGDFDIETIEGFDDETLNLMQHWVEELDGFQGRITNFQRSFRSSPMGPAVAATAGSDDSSEMAVLLDDVGGLEWMANDSNADDTSRSFSSTLYRRLLDLSNLLKSLDARINAASEARDRLASLSASNSAQTALERTRQLLLDATSMRRDVPRPTDSRSGFSTIYGTTTSDAVLAASERAHQLLNRVEDALLECATFLDDDDHGLSATLRSVRRSCPVSAEELHEYISEWNTLARKHWITPYQLPSGHATLKEELGGSVEARVLLPQAKEAENHAREELMAGYGVLTKARTDVCQRLSRSISARLPLLGMEQSRFEARLRPVKPLFLRSEVGRDEVDFYLLHTDDNDDGSGGRSRTSSASSPDSPPPEKGTTRGGRLESVASSGEKARILLAIECEIPGSIRALCHGTTPTILDEEGDRDDDDYYQDWSIPPVAVIYDEIDAHVGGRASVSVAQMLSDQAQSCQVFSITHSASLAAIADTHIRIQRGPSPTSSSLAAMGGGGRRGVALSVDLVTGAERRRELARMASGDMALEEAEVFAEALLRDASSAGRVGRRQQQQDQ
jgi:DNA repair ATPase RecN